VTWGGRSGRILEVRGALALVQPDPIRTRTRTYVPRGRYHRVEVVTGELLEWGPDAWIELRRLAPG